VINRRAKVGFARIFVFVGTNALCGRPGRAHRASPTNLDIYFLPIPLLNIFWQQPSVYMLCKCNFPGWNVIIGEYYTIVSKHFKHLIVI
jgi:hypothetical protein